MIYQIKDRLADDRVIMRIEFADQDEAEDKLPGIFWDLYCTGGSDTRFLYAELEELSPDDQQPIG
jgi:hypothetical protein